MLWISPRKYLGSRVRTRTDPPPGTKRSLVHTAIQLMIAQQAYEESCVVALAREGGLRLREACLLDVGNALTQAKKVGKIRVTRGTKGGYGRFMERWVPVTPTLLKALIFSSKVQGGRSCLVPATKTLIQFSDSVHHQWDKARTTLAIGKIHDLRAAYACDRYAEITGHPAPVLNGGTVVASTSADLQARLIISNELGHRRVDILAAYIGGRKR
ncbi:integrase domain-containing protein [Geoalkalibacter halelectricus]|uniref:integrase domain-containing protein n=1 Tax=Geoalkalibacter halelectricus TaxID=2847045 RepID=UPI003D1C989E